MNIASNMDAIVKMAAVRVSGSFLARRRTVCGHWLHQQHTESPV